MNIHTIWGSKKASQSPVIPFAASIRCTETAQKLLHPTYLLNRSGVLFSIKTGEAPLDHNPIIPIHQKSPKRTPFKSWPIIMSMNFCRLTDPFYRLFWLLAAQFSASYVHNFTVVKIGSNHRNLVKINGYSFFPLDWEYIHHWFFTTFQFLWIAIW